MSVELLTEHHLECLSLKGSCTGSSESTHVKIPHCWKSHVVMVKVTDFIREYGLHFVQTLKYHIRIFVFQCFLHIFKTGITCFSIYLLDLVYNPVTEKKITFAYHVGRQLEFQYEESCSGLDTQAKKLAHCFNLKPSNLFSGGDGRSRYPARKMNHFSS